MNIFLLLKAASSLRNTVLQISLTVLGHLAVIQVNVFVHVTHAQKQREIRD